MSTEAEVDTTSLENLDFEVKCSFHTYKNSTRETIKKCENPAKYSAEVYSHKIHKWIPAFICNPCLIDFIQSSVVRKTFCEQCREVEETIKDLRSI